MSKLAAIDAQVVDIQNDRQHKEFIKVTLHVPAERGPLLTEILGWPTYSTPVPVALARLQQGEATAPVTSIPAPEPPSKRMVTRAAILCLDPLFWRFLDERFAGKPPNINVTDETSAANMVRYACRVKSRSEILPNTAAGNRWDIIYSAWIAWKECADELTA